MLVCQQKNEKEPYPQPGTRIGTPLYYDQNPTTTVKTHEQEILSTEIERETARKGGWRSTVKSGRVKYKWCWYLELVAI